MTQAKKYPTKLAKKISFRFLFLAVVYTRGGQTIAAEPYIAR